MVVEKGGQIFAGLCCGLTFLFVAFLGDFGSTEELVLPLSALGGAVPLERLL